MFKKMTPQAIFSLKPATVWLLIVCQSLNVLMISQELTGWMLALISLCFLWQASSLIRPINKNNKSKSFIITLFAILGCVSIAFTGKQLGLLLSMLHLLSFAYALKGLELKSKKDFYQVSLLGLFILATSLIFQQTLGFSIVVLLIMIVNFSVLYHFYSADISMPSMSYRVAKMILQSVPLAVVLFVVFPRLAPFWQVPLSNSAKMGLSDSVTPGDIADLARSNELAFRVTFDNEKPSYSQLYWRALVFEQYDGRTWQRSDENIATAQFIRNDYQLFTPKVSGAFLSYQVIAQPSYQRWLFGLDLAVENKEQTSLNTSTAKIVELPDFTLQNKEIISQTLSYNIKSYLQTPLNKQLTKRLRAINLDFPIGSNPRLEQEAKRLRSLYRDDLTLAQAVLSQFRQDQYFYTLKPPLLDNNSLDQFFFDSKKGFCVHYSSTFTYLMRAAGIPARMVTGYMGGEFNPNGNYYSIYQSDAHAWSEIWLEGIGWQRIDPTSAVDPSRVESGFSEQLLNEQSSLNNRFFSFKHFRNAKWFQAIRLQISAIDYQWTRWVIGFTTKRQFDLLTGWFGQLKMWKIALMLLTTFTVMVLFLWLFNQQKNQKEPIEEWLVLYLSAIRLLKSKGIEKPTAMAAKDFCLLVGKDLPQIKPYFSKFTQYFMQLQYQSLSEEKQNKLIKLMKLEWFHIKKQL